MERLTLDFLVIVVILTKNSQAVKNNLGAIHSRSQTLKILHLPNLKAVRKSNNVVNPEVKIHCKDLTIKNFPCVFI